MQPLRQLLRLDFGHAAQRAATKASASGRLGLDMFFDAVDERGIALHADNAVNFLAVLDEEHGGDAHDVEASGATGIVIDIQLGDDHLSIIFSGQVCDGGGQHVAGAAPFRPEVDDGQLVGLHDRLFEIGVGNVDRLGSVGIIRYSLSRR